MHDLEIIKTINQLSHMVGVFKTALAL